MNYAETILVIMLYTYLHLWVSCVFKFQVIAVVSVDVFNVTNEQVQSLLSLFAKSSQGEFDECLQNLFFQCVFFVLVVLSFGQSVSQLYFRPFSPDL